MDCIVYTCSKRRNATDKPIGTFTLQEGETKSDVEQRISSIKADCIQHCRLAGLPSPMFRVGFKGNEDGEKTMKDVFAKK